MPNTSQDTRLKRALKERTYFSYNIKGKNHGRLAYSPFPIRTSDAGKIKRKRKRSFCSKENIMDYCKKPFLLARWKRILRLCFHTIRWKWLPEQREHLNWEAANLTCQRHSRWQVTRFFAAQIFQSVRIRKFHSFLAKETWFQYAYQSEGIFISIL